MPYFEKKEPQKNKKQKYENSQLTWRKDQK